jgi:hypothetical protein
MNIWVIRSLWILGAVALIAEMFLLANPRYRVPPPSEWETLRRSASPFASRSGFAQAM